MSELRNLPNDIVEKSGPFLRRLFEEFCLALSLLTRIALPRFEVRTGATIASAFWAYPIAGAIVGFVGAGAFLLGDAIGLGQAANCLLAFAAMTLFSGGLHEDGLADFCDGLGGKSQIERLQIMRDSRIGSFGVLALVFFIGLCVVFLFDISRQGSSATTVSALICVAAAGRTVVGIPLALLQPARVEGMSVAAQRPSNLALGVGAVILIALCFLLLGIVKSTFMLAAMVLGAVVMSGLAYRSIHGHTGDVLGATACVAMLFGLASLAIVGNGP